MKKALEKYAILLYHIYIAIFNRAVRNYCLIRLLHSLKYPKGNTSKRRKHSAFAFQGMVNIMNSVYESTRNKNILVSSSRAVLDGLAPDGGLFVMRGLDSEKADINSMLSMSYIEMAQYILGILLPDFPEQTMRDCVHKAYSKFDTPEITPIVKVGDNWILELFHGPTCAFKDVALQMLPRLVTASKELNGDSSETVILTATSGDTGKAALEGFCDVKNTKIIVFYPSDGVSVVQKAQMTTQSGNNTYVCGIKGDFDDAQTGVKKIFADDSVKELLNSNNKHFSSANSINVGRLAPQVVYYFYAYKKLIDNNAIKIGDKINFAVPTGNFGDILAGRYAQMLGLPINKLICASNSNNVLFDFINTGVYNRKRELSKTISPSMDILVSSNLERLLYYASGKDNELISTLMKNLAQNGEYTVPAEMLKQIQSEFYAGYANDAMTMATLKKYYDETAYVADTHTGVALNVTDAYKAATGDKTPTVVLSTASPFKFSNSVYSALFGADAAAKLHDEYAVMEDLSARTGCAIPAPLAELKNKPIRHNTVCAKNEMPDFVLKSVRLE